MVSLFLLLGCNLSYIADLYAALHELASASARTLLKLASSARALLKPYGDTLRTFARKFSNIDFFLRILPLKVDELVMSEMYKKWGVTDFVLEITCREEHPKSEKSGFFTE